MFVYVFDLFSQYMLILMFYEFLRKFSSFMQQQKETSDAVPLLQQQRQQRQQQRHERLLLMNKKKQRARRNIVLYAASYVVYNMFFETEQCVSHSFTNRIDQYDRFDLHNLWFVWL